MENKKVYLVEFVDGAPSIYTTRADALRAVMLDLVGYWTDILNDRATDENMDVADCQYLCREMVKQLDRLTRQGYITELPVNRFDSNN